MELDVLGVQYFVVLGVGVEVKQLVIEVQGDVITVLQFVTVLGSVDVFLGIVLGVEVNWVLWNYQQIVIVVVSQCCLVDMLMVIVVLWEGIVFEYGIDGVVLDIDDVSLLVVGVVFVWFMIVICYLIVFVVNFYGEIDVWNDVWIVVVMFVGKCYVNLVIGSDVLDVGVVYFEVKYWWGNNCVVDDQYFIIVLFYGKVVQMFLYDL